MAEGDKMDNEKNANFTPREYQLELYEKAAAKNSIIFLPTGSGKTFIASLLIKHYAKDVVSSFTEGGKRIFFLVNSVALVHQQAMSIRQYTPLSVKEYAGYMKVDLWNKEKWLAELDEAQVLVMTSQIFLNLLTHGYLKLTYVSLLIMDECHHARHNHAMKQIMERFEGYLGMDDVQLPRVCGLTATLLIGNSKPSNVLSDIRNLEIVMMSGVITAVNTEMVKMFSTNAKTCFVNYTESSNSECSEAVQKWIEESSQLVSRIPLKEYESLVVIGELVTDESKDIRKQVKKMFHSYKEILHNLGIYGAYVAVHLNILRYHRKTASHEDNVSFLVTFAITKLNELRAILRNYMSGSEELWPFRYSSQKLRYLLELVNTFPEDSSTVVFVETRITANTVCHIIKELVQKKKYTNILRPKHMVGFSGNPFKLDRLSALENRNNLEALKQFNNGDSNFLVASSVIEEGIDVRICDRVIKFDFPKTYRSYVQSKGRARRADSKFIVFVNGHAEEEAIYSFSILENFLKERMVSHVPKDISKEELDEFLFTSELAPFYTLGKTGPCINGVGAVQLVNSYCMTLPHDRFSRSVPYWSKVTQVFDGLEKTSVFLQLPLNAPIKRPLQGPWCPTFEVAKRAVALKMIRKLHELGEINDNLIPCGRNITLNNEKEIFPNWDDDDVYHPSLIGTNKLNRSCVKAVPKVLSKSYSNEYYLHIIYITPYEPSELESEENVFEKILNFPFNFGFITANKLPKLCGFTTAGFSGPALVSIDVNVETITLTERQINSLTKFHRLIFRSLNQFMKHYFFDSPMDDKVWYIVVPVFTRSHHSYRILWDVVEKHEDGIKLINDLESTSIVLEECSHVIWPNYKNIKDTLGYVFLKISDYTAESTPKRMTQTFRHYFLNKYGVVIKDLKRELLEARGISNRFDYLTPRESRIRISPYYFHPEMIQAPDLSSAFFIKGALLPSVLFRIYTLLLGEQLRNKITISAGLVWSSAESSSKILERTYADVVNKKEAPKDLPESDPQLKEENIDSSFDLGNGQCCLLDMQKFCDSLDEDYDIPIGSERKYIFEAVKTPPISFLLKHDLSAGPEQADIVVALTAASMCDLFSYERLELLGDSFLKFLATLALFTHFPEKDEGKLSLLKGKIIGNQNLLYCCRANGIDQYILCHRFSRLSMRIPGFNIPDKLVKYLKGDMIMESVLFKYEFTPEDIDGNDLTPACYQLLKRLSEECPEKIGRKQDFKHQDISDKVIADVGESLIGCYLTSCGVMGAAKFCQWLGVISKGFFDLGKVFDEITPSPLLDNTKTVPDYFMLDQLEVHIGYKFNNIAFLVQALTHASYTKCVTDCYQRLEFLGDSILDFLLTSYIYETCPSLDPGDLTDLRSALVNNNIFACYSVQLELYRFLLAESYELSSAIQKFIVHHISKNYEIGNDILLKVSENESNVAKDVEIPKALGDLYESLIGAIYLDSGKDLEVVWNIIYKVMHKEIEKYKKNIPKNPVRLLHEKCTKPPPVFGNSKVMADGQVVMILTVVINNVTQTFKGIGRTKASAKQAAAKLALKRIGC